MRMVINMANRVVIVDISHLAFKYAFGGASSLSTTVKMLDGTLQLVDTTLPTYLIKQVHRWADFGYNPTVVCFDAKGGNQSRKAYFQKYSGVSSEPVVEYKGTRDSMDNKFYDGLNMSLRLMLAGGVRCLKADGYEADDLIKAAVDRAKLDYPQLPIDVITGDADLLPLVDEQVSVFLSSKKTTWAESKDIEKRGYVQVTPANYQSYIESLSSYKNLYMPYNTVLLAKLLRGDKSDGIPAFPKFTPTMYRNLVHTLENNRVDLGSTFRYGNIDGIVEALEPHLTPEQLAHVKYIYGGININGGFTGLGERFDKKALTLTNKIEGYNAMALQREVSILRINLPFA